MNKKIVVVIILALTVFFGIISVYKFGIYDIENSYSFRWTTINTPIKNSKNPQLDKDIYKENVIMDNLLSIDYDFYDVEHSITGKVYIGNDKYVYITDSNKELVYRVSTTKFRTMYSKKYEYEDGIYIYLISEDNKLYFMELNDSDIKTATVKEANTKLLALNFVDIDFKNDIYTSSNTLFILSEDGNIYDVASGIRYQEDIISLYDILYVFGDNTLSNVYGKKIQNWDAKDYKIKYIFLTYDDNDFTGKNTYIIITEDNKLLCVYDDVDYVYEYVKTVTEIKFDTNYPYTKSKLKITFEDDSLVSLNASCNEYYCINNLK